MHDGDEMKPVAWMMVRDGEFFDAIHPDEHAKHEGDYTIPLYTAPRELSDEEITFLWHQSMNLAISDENLKNNVSQATIFAREILKKASEK